MLAVTIPPCAAKCYIFRLVEQRLCVGQACELVGRQRPYKHPFSRIFVGNDEWEYIITTAAGGTGYDIALALIALGGIKLIGRLLKFHM